MGKPSDRSKSAQRLGKRERARVKKHRRAVHILFGPGGGTVRVKTGRKHNDRYMRWFVKSHLSVVRNSESSRDTGRPGY